MTLWVWLNIKPKVKLKMEMENAFVSQRKALRYGAQLIIHSVIQRSFWNRFYEHGQGSNINLEEREGGLGHMELVRASLTKKGFICFINCTQVDLNPISSNKDCITY